MHTDSSGRYILLVCMDMVLVVLLMLMLLFNDDKNDEVVDGNIDESHASVRVYGSAQPTYYSALLILTLFG